MGIEEGTVAKWLKRVGDRVEKGEILVEVETAKALTEVEAPVSGTLLQILVLLGETAPVRTPLAVIEEDPGSTS
jgi:pyruvate/2-oxoglutarate dehydrogenase complex dihydrolipoamide acyltransferase (E2) component